MGTPNIPTNTSKNLVNQYFEGITHNPKDTVSKEGKTREKIKFYTCDEKINPYRYKYCMDFVPIK